MGDAGAERPALNIEGELVALGPLPYSQTQRTQRLFTRIRYQELERVLPLSPPNR